MFMTNMLSGERKWKVTQLPQSGWASELNLQCNILHSCNSERHFRSKDQACSHGAEHLGAGTPGFFVPSQIVLCPENFVLNI